MYQETRALNICFCLFLIGILPACDEVSTRALPGCTGKAGEVVVVMDARFWKGGLGESIANSLAREQEALPQPEPKFNVVHIPHSSFKGLFFTHRNIVIFNINNSNPEEITEENNVWATSQVVIRVSASTEARCLEMLGHDNTRLERILTTTERNRLRRKFLSVANKELASKLIAKFGVSLSVPKDYVIASEGDNFIWFRKETPEISQGIFIYTYDNGGQELNNVPRTIAMRDSVARHNIPGPLEGSYMATMHDFTPVSSPLNFAGTNAIETRGLWNVIGDFMGGPFISITFLSKDQTRSICVDGYVYAPKYDKRNYLRQVEAVLYSLEIVE
jgi:hypothetical protein